MESLHTNARRSRPAITVCVYVVVEQLRRVSATRLATTPSPTYRPRRRPTQQTFTCSMWLALLLVDLFLMTNVASQQVATEVDSSGEMRRQRLKILSPIDHQEFQKTRVVPIHGKLSSDGTMEKVCWKLVNDPGCYGFISDQAKASAARKDLAVKADYHGCSALPVKGNLVLAAGCWILQFDLLDQQNVILEMQFRSIHVVTVDEMVEEYYPGISRLQGGSIGMMKYAFRNRGMGMILEFGIGMSTELLSRECVSTAVQQTDQMIHSFDSLLGLPDSWREGFWKGTFSFHGDIPLNVKGLPHVEIHAGWVEETLPPFLLANPQAPIGFLFLDMCVEASTAFVLEAIACRLGRGTVVLFGSYFNYPQWTETAGERSAWLAAVDRWGIEFENIGFSSTFYMVRVTEMPHKCPNSSSAVVRDDKVDPVIREWASDKIQRALQDVSDMERIVREMEEVLAVDHTNAEALGYLAFALEDISRISDRFDYARRALVLQHKMPANGTDPLTMLTTLHKEPMHGPKFERRLHKHRLLHDLEQLRYIQAKHRLPSELTKRAIAAYEEVVAQLSEVSDDEFVVLTWSQWATIGPYFNRVLYLPILSRVKSGGLNPAIDFNEVQAAYNNSDPHVVVVDDFLSQDALAALLRYYREATVFFDLGRISYVGTYLVDGVGNPVLAQVVEELVEKLRPILCDRPLVQAWVYKYDDKLQRGINIHADKAAVNFNLWLGENNSVDPDRGGLVVFTEKPPEDWDFDRYNTDPPRREVLEMLEHSGYRNVTVPYKQNRMIMFDSKLFHVSDIDKWRQGYERRRINLTLLFGRAGSSCKI